MINIKNLSKNYGNKEILKDIKLSTEKEKVHGIIGKNGAGKTSLFNCIAGLTEHEGTIESEFQILKNHIAYLMTNPYFLPKITGLEYITLMLRARGIKKVNIKERNIFSLPLGNYASEYSTGMKKKLALTAILLQKNDLFILDEPFNGVDIEGNMLITQIIRKLKSLGKSVIISSHIFSTLKGVCDDFHLLDNGILIKKEISDIESEMNSDRSNNEIDNFLEDL